MNVRNPKVSVLMPVYNSEKFLREAIESILNQTYKDFEFLIINDGSTDSSEDIILSYSDSRIRLIRNERNIGLSQSLNKGLELAKGKYIARMDSDDIALPHRLEKQITFLNSYPEVGILGTDYILIDTKNRNLGINKGPINDLQIRWECLLRNPFAHTTVLIRSDSLLKNGLSYSVSSQATEDYDLWTRVLKYTHGANLSEPLMRYRVHSDSVSNKYREIQLKNHNIIAFRSIREQLPEFNITPEQVGQLCRLFAGGSKSVVDLDKKRVILAEVYLNMFKAFMDHNSLKANLKELQHREALKIALVALNKPFRFKWVPILGRLMNMDKSLLWGLPSFMLKTTYLRFVQRVRHSILWTAKQTS